MPLHVGRVVQSWDGAQDSPLTSLMENYNPFLLVKMHSPFQNDRLFQREPIMLQLSVDTFCLPKGLCIFIAAYETYLCFQRRGSNNPDTTVGTTGRDRLKRMIGLLSIQ
jgi:hypothetical protein